MRKLLYTFCLLGLTSCALRSQQSEFYVLNSLAFSDVSARKMDISVNQVRVPEMLDRSQIVVYDSDDKINILEFHRWAEVYPSVLQSAITNNLIKYLPKSFVKSAYFETPNAKYNVNIEINKVDSYLDEKVTLSAWWNVTDSNGKVLTRQYSNYETKLETDKIKDIVKAQSELVSNLSKDIAKGLSKLP